MGTTPDAAPPPDAVVPPDAAPPCASDPLIGSPCTVGVGACAATGVRECGPTGETVCSAVPGTPGPETCADVGTDDDCDGVASDVDGAGEACDTGLLGVCAAGRRACFMGALVCEGTTLPGAETCANLGSDDDCDGDDADLEVDLDDHVLLSEIATRPTGAEFVELWNPTRAPVSLAGYGLADFTTYHAAPWGPYPTRAASSDFIVSFPPDAALAPCARAVVSVGKAADFAAAYGAPPDFEIVATSQLGGPDDDPAVPNLTQDLGANVPTTRGLTDDGELVILFRLDANGVRDVDYVVWGPDTAVRVDKTGLPGYRPDTPPALQDALAAPGAGKTLHRCVAGETGEHAGAGNGVTGHDETSERLNLAWDTAPAPSPWQAEPGCTISVCTDTGAIGGDCTAGLGVCAAPGAWACGPTGANLVCEGPTGLPGAELCSNVGSDDDCDGDAADVDGEGDACGASCQVKLCQGDALVCTDARDHLVVTEVIVTPTLAEAIEILNPTALAVDLTNVALADFNTYHRVPAGPFDGASTADFVVRFPAGATIAPCQRIVISVKPAVDFQGATGVWPDYEILSAAETGGAVDTPAVPNMLANLGMNATGSRGLANDAEIVVLFAVDASGNRDLDYVVWGSDPAVRVDKSAEPGFQPDTAPDLQDSLGTVHADGGSFHRCRIRETGEIESGGNGLTGHDETSEPLRSNWRKAATWSPGGADPACP